MIIDISQILSFLVASIALTFMPGPDNIYIITESLSRGTRVGIVTTLGLVSGVLIHTVLVASGISIILKESQELYAIIQILGAVYLFYLAFLAWKEKPILIKSQSSKTLETDNSYKDYVKGLFMNLLNPKVALFFIAFLPQFVNKEAGQVTSQMLILGLVFFIQGLIFMSSFAILAGRLTTILNSEKFWNYTKWIKIAVLILIGISIMII